MIVAAITKDLWLDTSAAKKGNTGSITLWFYKFYSEQKDQSFAKYKTNLDIGIPSVRVFDQEVKKYCYMWREGGQFSTGKYLSEAELENKTGN